VGEEVMRRRKFLQNKLWRDNAIEMMEKSGAVVHWQHLDTNNYEKELRLKLLEEAKEVETAITREELCEELADVLEVVACLCKSNDISLDDVHKQQNKKRTERGGFAGRKYVTVVEHLDNSFWANYCLKDPDKNPEILESVE
jgi:predicted house-cleaning noncanonical NTP pyrophosphatase (MazG superfamily)